MESIENNNTSFDFDSIKKELGRKLEFFYLEKVEPQVLYHSLDNPDDRYYNYYFRTTELTIRYRCTKKGYIDYMILRNKPLSYHSMKIDG